MDKSKYVNKKIQDYYKQKYINKKINEKYAKKSKENNVKKYYKQKHIKQNIVKKYIDLSKDRPIYRIIINLSKRVNKKLKELGIEKNFKYSELLGCSIDEFEEYLIDKMDDNMTFENYGEWEVDHIIPFSRFNFYNTDEIKKCSHYANLRPLWKQENREKYNHYN